MQRDCIIGWKDNSKLDDPNRFVMVFFFLFEVIRLEKSLAHEIRYFI